MQVWGSTFDNYINPLFIIQKKVVRLISHVKIKDDNGNYNHSSLLFKDLRVLKIKDIFRNQIALLVFDCLQGTSNTKYQKISNTKYQKKSVQSKIPLRGLQKKC